MKSKLIALTAAIALAASYSAFSQNPVRLPGRPQMPGEVVSEAGPVKDPVNYVIRVEWKETKGATRHLEVLTTEGRVELQTFLPEKVKVGDEEIAISVTLQATLNVLSEEKGKLQLFLGRSVPYVTSSTSGSGGRTSSYQSRSVGVTSSFGVIFGKPLVIQSDETEKVTILIKRADG